MDELQRELIDVRRQMKGVAIEQKRQTMDCVTRAQFGAALSLKANKTDLKLVAKALATAGLYRQQSIGSVGSEDPRIDAIERQVAQVNKRLAAIEAIVSRAVAPDHRSDEEEPVRVVVESPEPEEEEQQPEQLVVVPTTITTTITKEEEDPEEEEPLERPATATAAAEEKVEVEAPPPPEKLVPPPIAPPQTAQVAEKPLLVVVPASTTTTTTMEATIAEEEEEEKADVPSSLKVMSPKPDPPKKKATTLDETPAIEAPVRQPHRPLEPQSPPSPSCVSRKKRTSSIDMFGTQIATLTHHVTALMQHMHAEQAKKEPVPQTGATVAHRALELMIGNQAKLAETESAALEVRKQIDDLRELRKQIDDVKAATIANTKKCDDLDKIQHDLELLKEAKSECRQQVVVDESQQQKAAALTVIGPTTPPGRPPSPTRSKRSVSATSSKKSPKRSGDETRLASARAHQETKVIEAFARNWRSEQEAILYEFSRHKKILRRLLANYDVLLKDKDLLSK